MTPVSRETVGGRAYLDLQSKARRDGRTTDELVQLYALEGFLARLSVSSYIDRLVLKGGVLLAAFGDRRPTRDVDLAGVDLDNDTAHVLGVVRAVAATTPALADGLAFDLDSAHEEVIRSFDEYSGVRVSMSVGLATARVGFHVDLSVGDPIWPSPQRVAVPRLLEGPDIEVRGYPMEMALAEKIVTALERGPTSTRWRDFGDIWTLSSNHALRGSDLQDAVGLVAEHRGTEAGSLERVLNGFAEVSQARWAAWRRKMRLAQLPEEFADVLAGCVRFADPALRGDVTDQTWDPSARRWTSLGDRFTP